MHMAQTYGTKIANHVKWELVTPRLLSDQITCIGLQRKNMKTVIPAHEASNYCNDSNAGENVLASIQQRIFDPTVIWDLPLRYKLSSYHEILKWEMHLKGKKLSTAKQNNIRYIDIHIMLFR